MTVEAPKKFHRRTKTVPVAVRFRADTKQMLEDLAAADDRSMANYLERLIEREYDKLHPEQK